jgi:hypothetical protein
LIWSHFINLPALCLRGPALWIPLACGIPMKRNSTFRLPF